MKTKLISTKLLFWIQNYEVEIWDYTGYQLELWSPRLPVFSNSLFILFVSFCHCVERRIKSKRKNNQLYHFQSIRLSLLFLFFRFVFFWSGVFIKYVNWTSSNSCRCLVLRSHQSPFVKASRKYLNKSQTETTNCDIRFRVECVHRTMVRYR